MTSTSDHDADNMNILTPSTTLQHKGMAMGESHHIIPNPRIGSGEADHIQRPPPPPSVTLQHPQVHHDHDQNVSIPQKNQNMEGRNKNKNKFKNDAYNGSRRKQR